MNDIKSLEKNNSKDEDIFGSLLNKSTRKLYRSLQDYVVQTVQELHQDVPFYVYDLADILWKTQLWYDRFPNIHPYFAVKANSNPVLVKLFVLLGHGFDCSTEGEIRYVMSFGADPTKIIFAHTIKTPSALKHAASVGVDLMTFESKEEVLKIKKFFPTARLVLRLKAKNTQKILNLNDKYGCEMSETEGLLITAKDLGMDVVGISFHVGGLCQDPKIYTTTIDDCRQLFDTAKQLGFKFTILDIGGGFFGSAEKEDFFINLSQEIQLSLEKNFPIEDIQIIAEPGGYFVCSSGSLVTCITGKRNLSHNDDSMAQKEYFLNDSCFGSFFVFRDLFDYKPIPVVAPEELEKRPKYKSKVWGQTCCSTDVVKEIILLPDMEEEEFIRWTNMGAYARSFTSKFTMVPYPTDTYVFIQNPRLQLDGIPNFQAVTSFIAEVSTLIEKKYK